MFKIFIILMVFLFIGFIGMFIFPFAYSYLGDPLIDAAFQFMQIIILLVILSNIYDIKKRL